MKILIVCPGFSKQNTNLQPWQYFNMIGNALEKLGHYVYYLTNNNQYKNNYIYFPKFRSFPFGVDNRLKKIIVNNKIDLLIWNGGAMDFLYINKVDSLNIPIIFVITLPKYTFGEIKIFYWDLIFKPRFFLHFIIGALLGGKIIGKLLNSKKIKAVIFQSRENKKRFLKNIMFTKGFVIHPTLSPEFEKELSKERKQLQSKKYIVSYFGPLLSQRGVNSLLIAFQKVESANPEAELIIYARMDKIDEHKKNLKKIKSIIQKLKLNNVTLIENPLSVKKLISSISNSNCVCLPFKFVISDAPLILQEVKAVGTPMITSNILGIKEFTTQEDILVDPNNDIAIANGIEEIINRKNNLNIIKFQKFNNFKYQVEQVIENAKK